MIEALALPNCFASRVEPKKKKTYIRRRRRRILLHNLSKYFKRETSTGKRKHCENIETSPSHVETSSKTFSVPSRYKFRDGSSVKDELSVC